MTKRYNTYRPFFYHFSREYFPPSKLINHQENFNGVHWTMWLTLVLLAKSNIVNNSHSINETTIES